VEKSDELARLRAERMESLGRLAGRIAHDVNNMLGVVVNYANFVIEEASAPEPDISAISADAQQIIRAGERGTNLTQQLLAFAGRSAARPEVLDLNQVISSLGAASLDFRPDPSLPTVNCDPEQISRLLANLIDNARDAMPSDGVVVIDTARHGDQVRLRVSDSGAGMTATEAERAFEPFSAAGLRLAMVYGIVTQAGGQVDIESSPGVGTTVTVLLPAMP
jgi:signal transduction histidine kinase